MTTFSYRLTDQTKPNLGLIVLQSDETIESDFRELLPPDVNLYVSRVPSALDVSRETLQQMEAHVPQSAALFPQPVAFDAIGYGCTSGTAQIGQDRIATQVNSTAKTKSVTEPVSALIAACTTLGLKRIAFLSPYVESVSDQLRLVLAQNGIETPTFGSFDEAEEAKVVRISRASVFDAAKTLGQTAGIDGLFLSCTNLHTLDVIEDLEAELGLPVLSSNQVLAWHMCKLANAPNAKGVGQLFPTT